MSLRLIRAIKLRKYFMNVFSQVLAFFYVLLYFYLLFGLFFLFNFSQNFFFFLCHLFFFWFCLLPVFILLWFSSRLLWTLVIPSILALPWHMDLFIPLMHFYVFLYTPQHFILFFCFACEVFSEVYCFYLFVQFHVWLQNVRLFCLKSHFILFLFLAIFVLIWILWLLRQVVYHWGAWRYQLLALW